MEVNDTNENEDNVGESDPLDVGSEGPDSAEEPAEKAEVFRTNKVDNDLELRQLINRYPFLDSEEELKLISLYQKKGDKNARNTVLLHNMKLAYDYSHPRDGCERSDLFHAGIEGLEKALDKFDPKRGVRFRVYAIHWVRHATNRYVQNNTSTIRLPVHVSDKYSKIRNHSNRLRAELGREPTTAEVAAATGLTIGEVSDVYEQKKKHSLLSLDKPLVTDPTETLGSLVSGDRSEEPDRIAQANEAIAFLNKIAQTLPELDRKILTMRMQPDEFGRQRSFDEIGAKVQRSGEFVRLRIINLLSQIRNQFGDEAESLLSD